MNGWSRCVHFFGRKKRWSDLARCSNRQCQAGFLRSQNLVLYFRSPLLEKKRKKFKSLAAPACCRRWIFLLWSLAFLSSLQGAPVVMLPSPPNFVAEQWLPRLPSVKLQPWTAPTRG